MTNDNRMAKIMALRNNIQERQKNKDTVGRKTFGDPRFYPFYAIDVDQKSTLRFTPDADETNPNVFYKEQLYYEWEFLDPDNLGSTLKVRMPCRNMFTPRTCGVYRRINDIYNTGNKELGGKFYLNRSYLLSGFVRSSDLVEDPAPTMRIRTFDFNKRLFKSSIEAALGTTDEDSPLYLVHADPTDYEAGVDFVVRKTKGPQYPSYETSGFARRSTPLTADELAAIQSEGLTDLRSMMMKEPANEAAWAIQADMLEAGIAGEMWNKDWEEYWKPMRPRKAEGSDDSSPVKETAPMVKAIERAAAPAEASSAPAPTPAAAPAAAAPGGSSPAELLARIKSRNTAAQ